jgi:hypothetical protein
METKSRKRRPKIARLTSVSRCGVEIGKLYRLMRCGELNTSDGMRMVQSLLGLKACLETSEIEARIKALEETITNRNQSFKPRVVPFTDKPGSDAG